ncbi:HPF/RaiA family ribosome-associated protein [Haliangium sp.]|uniref:HPF/RaiA family ribosome-associated protein n=1 Tax=Haliangium sp. TaxID=2663208 RepID=UPI003D0E1375
MTVPLQITFRNMNPSDTVEAAIRDKIASLDQFYEGITGGHVVVDLPHRHGRKGHTYQVNVELSVPGQTLVVSRAPGRDEHHEDIHLAVRDAFRAARRALQDYARKRRGQIKTHEAPPHGRITQLFADDGYGFLQGPDGRDIYFHENSVVNGFESLTVGDLVSYHEDVGDKGPQATAVMPAA